MAYHGWEVFDNSKMNEYANWNQIKVLPSSLVMVYVAKTLELVTGIGFMLGIFTRIAALLMAGIMLFVCFFVGNGRFYYEDQHPFIFALLALVFFFTGPGSFAMDRILFRNAKRMYS